MKTREHVWISGLLFTSILGIIGGVIVDIFFLPIFYHDFKRKINGLPFKELNTILIKLNWFCHTIWIIFILLAISLSAGINLIFWKSYVLHIILDVCTHSEDRAIKLFYPISNKKIDLWGNYVKKRN